MNDIKSKIVIEDGFSDTLEDLAKETESTTDALDNLNESFKYFGKTTQDQTKYTERLIDVTEDLSDPLEDVKDRLSDISTNSSRMFKEFAIEKITRIGSAIAEIKTNLVQTVSAFAMEKALMFRDAAIQTMDRFEDISLEKFQHIVDYLRDFIYEIDMIDQAVGGLLSTQQRFMEYSNNFEFLNSEFASSVFAMYNGSLDAVSQMIILKQSIEEALLGQRGKDIFFTITKNFVANNLKPIGEFIDELSHIDLWTSGEALGKIDEAFSSKKFISKIQSYGKAIGKGFAINIGIAFSKNIIVRFKNSLQEVKNLFDRSLNDLMAYDKFTSDITELFDEAGANAHAAALELANEIGADAGMIANKAQEAAFKGIGTKSFERITKLADKVTKLSTGENLESVIYTLMNNVKEGHDAETLARTLGGGDVMARKLKSAGYERALNRGDLSKALDIAEKIAEKSGLTEERYKKASNTLSQNYIKIQNIIKNIRSDLDASMTGEFAGTIEKLKNFLESDTAKRIVGGFKVLVEYLANSFAKSLEFVLDNLSVLPSIVLAGIIGKMYVISKSTIANLKILGATKGILVWITSKLGLQKVSDLIKDCTAKSIRQFIVQKSIAGLKLAAPWIAVSAAIAGALYGAYALSDTSKTFSGWLKGIVAAFLQLLGNIGENIGTFFVNLENEPEIMFWKIVKVVNKAILFINTKVGELFDWIQNGIDDLLPDFMKSGSIVHDITGSLTGPLGGLFNGLRGFQKGSNKLLREGVLKEDEKLKKLLSKPNSLIDYKKSDEGVADAYDSEGQTYLKYLDKISNELGKWGGLSEKLKKIGEEGFKLLTGVADDTDSIRKFNEQEEDLRWLKAFSDRQIMSSYNSMTSNTRNVTINGMSQAGLAEMGRRNIATLPSRHAL